MERPDQSELTMERVHADVPARQSSGIKTILFHVHDDEGLVGRLEVALSLARACGAHLRCLHITPIEAYTMVDGFGGTFVNAEIVRAMEEQAQGLRQRITAELSNENMSWDYDEITGQVVGRLIDVASLSDLVITGREPHRADFGGPAVTLMGDLLEELRAPMLVLPERQQSFDPLGVAVIGWNGSYEAANAVRSSVGLLRLAGEVRIVQFEEPEKDRFPSTTLLEYLSRHGIKAELDVRTPSSRKVDIALIDYARECSADYLVVGAYSHSRAGQWLFGGVTRSLLKACPLPLLLAR